MKRIICLALCLFLLCVLPLMAQKTVTLTLTDNTNPAGVKYYCYHRMTGGTYSSADRKDLATAKTYAWMLAAPVALGTHYFACTAYYLDGAATLESPYSNEFSWVNAPVAPTITGTVAGITMHQATLMASTSVPSKTILQYGYSPQSLTATKIVDTSLVLNHSITLTKLMPHTRYYYRWTATDQSGQSIMYSGSFSTL